MKKPKQVRNAAQECELRRWCVEQAIRWPTTGGFGSMQSTLGGYVPPQDADVLGRALKLLNWVNGS